VPGNNAAFAPKPELLQLNPDFPNRARRLIGHFVKPNDQVDGIIGTLKKAGLTI
jgi:hypothetical protein